MLTLVSTPIGNLGDMSPRALETLRSADVVVSEDTRKTGMLLKHFEISKAQISFREDNERRALPKLMDLLREGKAVALVTDAGTPSVSDPGYRLAAAAIAAGVRVEPIPGASAVMAGLVGSGLPTDAFVFAGFPPPKSSARRTWFRALRAERRTIVFFEAPHRILAALADALGELGDRNVAVGRELTKVHEDWVRGPISATITRIGEPRGEFTVVLAGHSGDEADTGAEVTDQQLLTEFGHMTENGLGRREAISALAETHKMRSRDVFAALDRARHS